MQAECKRSGRVPRRPTQSEEKTRIWSSIPAFRGEAKETTWIYRVAWNTALAWQRGERWRREGHETFVKLSPSPQAQPSHLDSLPEQEVVERLYAAIRRLPKVDAPLALLHLDGLSYQEMADVLLKEVRRNQQHFRAGVFWRDFREVGVAAIMTWLFLHWAIRDGGMVVVPAGTRVF